MKVFSNTTPFISLCSVNLLHLMPAIFGTVAVAEAVADECNAGGKFFVPDLTGLPWVSVQAVQSEKQLPALFELDRGERDTLLLAAQQTDALVLMDEKLGRNLAEYMEIQVMGTLGILAKARCACPVERASKLTGRIGRDGANIGKAHAAPGTGNGYLERSHVIPPKHGQVLARDGRRAKCPFRQGVCHRSAFLQPPCARPLPDRARR